jgi:hypothetical protein
MDILIVSSVFQKLPGALLISRISYLGDGINYSICSRTLTTRFTMHSLEQDTDGDRQRDEQGLSSTGCCDDCTEV